MNLTDRSRMLSAIAAAQRRNRTGVSIGNRVAKVVDAAKPTAPTVKKKSSDRKRLVTAQPKGKASSTMSWTQRTLAEARAEEMKRRRDTLASKAARNAAQSQQTAANPE